MPTIELPRPLNTPAPNIGGYAQKLINLTQTAWHAAFVGGSGAFDVSSGFADPSAAEASRVPELELDASGTPGTYTITGTWDSVEQVVNITTIAGSTVKGDLPLDTVTRFQGPDCGATKSVTLYHGDSYADPPARALWTGDTDGDAAVQLVGEDAVKAVAVPANRDWPRRVQRIAHSTSAVPSTLQTSGTGRPAFVW
jgi:hypothetical protein